MKKLIGVLVVTFAITVGLYSYSRLLNNQNSAENQPSSTPATISKPFKSENMPKNEPLPELGSFKGLEEESTNLFNDVDGLPHNKASRPLEDVIQ